MQLRVPAELDQLDQRSIGIGTTLKIVPVRFVDHVLKLKFL